MKKKFYYAGMLAAGLLTFASCNNDEDPIIDQNQVQTEVEEGQVIRIAVANTGDGLTTRAGRPLFSSEAKQAIDVVKVYIVKTEGGTTSILAEKEFTNWTSDATSEPYDNHGRQATWKLSGDERLDVNADYTAYAVGYTSSGSLYQNAIETYSKQTVGSMEPFSKFLSSSDIADGTLGEEIFAGALTFHVDGEGNIDVSQDPEANVLTLHRQVAGTMGYFTSIPTVKVGQYVKFVEDKTGTGKSEYKLFGTDIGADGETYVDGVKDLSLQLVSSNISSKIYMDFFNSAFTEAQADNSTAWFIVNGVKVKDNISVTKDKFVDADGKLTKTNGYVLYSIKLSDWFPNGDVNNDGLLDEGDAAVGTGNWSTPSSVQGASFVAGSVFAGTFLIPFEKVDGQNTLQLQLIKKGEATPIRTWNINLPEDDTQLLPEAGHTRVWDGNVVSGFPALNADEAAVDAFYNENFPFVNVDENEVSYSFVRNHLYSIGVKETDIEGPTDEPEELSKGQRLILKVNDNWEMIHHMVVD